MPLVSIIMPLFNKERDVERAIRSVLAQTVRDFELIVVNDGSTDKGPHKVRTFTDKRIRLIEQSNEGVSSARNRGIKTALSDLVAFLDADDEWDSHFLETILQLRKSHPSCDVYATGYYFCGNDYKRQAIIRGLPRNFKEGILRNYFNIAAHSDPPLSTSAVAVSKRAILSVNNFPTGVTCGEDLLTWARLASKYDIAYSSGCMTYFWEPGSIDDRPGRTPQTPDTVGQGLLLLKQEGVSDRVKDLEKYLSLWHKMQANIYIRLGNPVAARKQLWVAMKFAMNIRLFILYGLTFIPTKSAARILESKKRIR